MPGTTAGFKKPVPLLWVVGNSDRLFQAGPDFAYNKATANVLSKYLEVQAGHTGTPDVAAEEVVAWIKSLLEVPPTGSP